MSHSASSDIALSLRVKEFIVVVIVIVHSVCNFIASDFNFYLKKV